MYSVYLCRKFPHLRSVVIDKPETLAAAREMIAGCVGEGRIELLEADIATDPLGKMSMRSCSPMSLMRTPSPKKF